MIKSAEDIIRVVETESPVLSTFNAKEWAKDIKRALKNDDYYKKSINNYNENKTLNTGGNGQYKYIMSINTSWHFFHFFHDMNNKIRCFIQTDDFFEPSITISKKTMLKVISLLNDKNIIEKLSKIKFVNDLNNTKTEINKK